jgi:CheY-like chemotaxis protein
MDGYAVARRLRQEPALEGTMLVAVTGYGQDEDRERAIAAGFEHHLVKPVDLDALRRVLDESRTPAWSALSDHAWKDLPVCGEPNLPCC